VGDAFIASTGCVPDDGRTLQENAICLARLALDMQKLCATLRTPDNMPVVMRIGLHCGPVVGGIVGGNSARPQLRAVQAPLVSLQRAAFITSPSPSPSPLPCFVSQ